ncbi:DinB family protein [Rhodanobacter sp. L36]|uniref:DinB family protein n=1 Tax=Rhodanobacter sp. L36 TaxID=1747221 RepID=UPI00131BA6CD|nr:DinB family protein [Rhodanobacter sp. L36]
MSLKHSFELLAAYTRWMNVKVYDASASLGEAMLHADQGAFFGSIFRTLDHLITADTIWLKRFAEHPSNYRSLDPVRLMAHPYSLTESPRATFGDLCETRQRMDEVIIEFVGEIAEKDLDQTLTYTNRSNKSFAYPFDSLLLHFFNHQTHHRGQVTTLLSQNGIDVGITDLAGLLAEYSRPA